MSVPGLGPENVNHVLWKATPGLEVLHRIQCLRHGGHIAGQHEVPEPLNIGIVSTWRLGENLKGLRDCLAPKTDTLEGIEVGGVRHQAPYASCSSDGLGDGDLAQLYITMLLEEAGGHGELDEDLKMIVTEADRCKKIVSGLLNFARQNRVVRAPVDVCELVDRTLCALNPPEGVKVEIKPEVEDPVAELVQDQIVQILTNLVTNAYTAMPEGGRLTVEVGGDRGNVSLKVMDTGIGISRDNLKKIFHPFFTTKQIGKGTGLGLAITYGIVKMHRGSITCESNADPGAGPTGTTFTIALPRKVEGSEVDEGEFFAVDDEADAELTLSAGE